MSVPQDASKNQPGSNGKEQKVIVLSMKNMPSFKFDVTKSLLTTNQDNGQSVFSFKPQQLIQSPQAMQPKTSATTIQVVSPPVASSINPMQKIKGTGGTILIRAQSPTASVQKQPTKQLSLIGHPNIKIQENPSTQVVRKISPEITMKNHAGHTLLLHSPTGKNQQVSISQLTSTTQSHTKKILIPVSSGQSQGKLYQMQSQSQKVVQKQPVKIIQSTVKETPKPIPILPKPDTPKILVQQHVILPPTAVIVQQTSPQIKSNQNQIITIPGSSFTKYNVTLQSPKWNVPALTPIQPKVSITPALPKVKKAEILVEVNDNYDENSSESEILEGDVEMADDDQQDVPEMIDIQPEKLIENEEQFTIVKRIIEGDDMSPTVSDNIVENIENMPSEQSKNTPTIVTLQNNNKNNSSNNSMLLCDEQIASITPEESPESSNKSKDQLTPVHLNEDASNKSQLVEEVKKNLKLDLISTTTTNLTHDQIVRMEIDENDSILSDENSNQSSVATEKKNNDDSSPSKNEDLSPEATTSKNDQNKTGSSKRSRKPKNPTVNTSLGLPYKPPQPSSRKKKIEKKVELEMDFHDPLNKILWEDGIGGLNNCNKLFGFNEFGLIEVLSKKDATAKLKTYEENASSLDDNGNFKFRKIVDPQDQFVCIICSKYGTVRDFFSPECCTESCYAITKRKTTDISSTSKDENNDSGLNSPTDTKKVMFDGETMPLQQMQQYLLEQHLPESKRKQKRSQRKFSYGIPEVKFSWETYLTPKSVPAPEKLFIHTSKTATTHFRVGMKLEAIDPKNQHLFCVCTVEEKLGCRMKLHFDGYPVSYDFWTNSDSFNIFPAGFCQSSGRKLNVPPRWNNKKFDWSEYCDHTNSVGAQKYMFPRLAPSDDENLLAVGMKLEVKFENGWYAATIIDVINSRILIRFDGMYENFGCFWYSTDSPYLNYCDGHKLLEDPSVFKSPFEENSTKMFSWTEYLKETESKEAPKEFLIQKSREPYQFEPGMKLEVVDKVNPQLIRPATILNQSGYKIQVIFDGFEINYSYWLDDDSEEIHPINYCKQTEHPIEHPAGANKFVENSLCSMNGCRGIGNGLHADRYFHDASQECPYNVENWKRLIEQKDNSRLEYKPYVRRNKNVSTNEADKSRSLLLQSAKVKKEKKEIKVEPLVEFEETSNDTVKVAKKRGKKRKLTQPKVVPEKKEKLEEEIHNDEHKKVKMSVVQHFLQNYGPQINYAYGLWTKNSKVLDKISITGEDCTENPIKWTVDDVCTFLVKYCDEETTAKFYAQQIDGEAFLGLCQNDLVTLMGIKVGPAIKIYNRILWLRQEFMTKFVQF